MYFSITNSCTRSSISQPQPQQIVSQRRDKVVKNRKRTKEKSAGESVIQYR